MPGLHSAAPRRIALTPSVDFGAFPSAFAAAQSIGVYPFALPSRRTRFIGGGQIGFNWQFGPIVARSRHAGPAPAGHSVVDALQSFAAGGQFQRPCFRQTATVTRRLDYFGTARGRLGFAFDRALIYATGGLAVGGTNLTYSGRIGFPVAPTIFLAGTSSVAKAKIGYTLGGGVEYAVWNNWSVKAEYLITTSVGNRRRSVARSRISPR